jgi:glycerol-3-phosphate dehydrogenase
VADGGVQLAIREVVYDHGARGGPRGLYSVSGVKFTTARLVAAKTLRAIFGNRGEPLQPWESVRRPPTRAVPGLGEFKSRLRDGPDGLRADLRRLVAEEAVLHLEDLLLRRTDWGMDPREVTALGEAVRGLLGDAAPPSEVGSPPTPWR